MYKNKIFCVYCLITMIFLSVSCGYNNNDQLYVSAGNGDLTSVKKLLAKGADPNHRYLHLQREFEPYETPIIAAAENGHLDIVKTLVEAGAELEARNTYTSQTALYKAVEHKHRDVIEYLLSKGADPMTEESFGKNILMLAIIQDDFDLIRLLVKYGAWPDPNEVCADSIAGRVALDAIGISVALKRPYTGYLRQALVDC